MQMFDTKLANGSPDEHQNKWTTCPDNSRCARGNTCCKTDKNSYRCCSLTNVTLFYTTQLKLIKFRQNAVECFAVQTLTVARRMASVRRQNLRMIFLISCTINIVVCVSDVNVVFESINVFHKINDVLLPI